MSYSALLDVVSNYMNRSDLTSEIPEFIASVEADINTFLATNPVRPMASQAIGTASTTQIELPDDYLDSINLQLSDGTNSWPVAKILLGTDFTYFADKALVPGAAYLSANPQQYKVFSNNIVLSVTPAAELSYTLDYWAKVAAVNEDNATNWLMDNHPNVYKFGTLAHAAHRIRDYDYRDQNRDLFENELGAVQLAYPERAGPIGLRMTDSPFRSNCRNAFYA